MQPPGVGDSLFGSLKGLRCPPPPLCGWEGGNYSSLQDFRACTSWPLQTVTTTPMVTLACALDEDFLLVYVSLNFLSACQPSNSSPSRPLSHPQSTAKTLFRNHNSKTRVRSETLFLRTAISLFRKLLRCVPKLFYGP